MTVFEDPAEAARGATRVHLSLAERRRRRRARARATGPRGRRRHRRPHDDLADGLGDAGEASAERGIAFENAPVFMGPQNALEGNGIMLDSGDRARFDALAPELSKMTGKLLYLGAEPSARPRSSCSGICF